MKTFESTIWKKSKLLPLFALFCCIINHGLKCLIFRWFAFWFKLLFLKIDGHSEANTVWLLFTQKWILFTWRWNRLYRNFFWRAYAGRWLAAARFSWLFLFFYFHVSKAIFTFIGFGFGAFIEFLFRFFVDAATYKQRKWKKILRLAERKGQNTNTWKKQSIGSLITYILTFSYSYFRCLLFLRSIWHFSLILVFDISI